MSSNNNVYLDYNATAPTRPEAIEAAVEILKYSANASSVHRFGSKVKSVMNASRSIISDYICADPSEIFFNSGGTEGNSTVLNGFSRPILVSSIEHDSIIVPAETNKNFDSLIRVKKNGVIDLENLEKILDLSPIPVLVSVMYANNETGIIQPVAEVARLTKKYNAIFHCDAVQALGKLHFDVESIGADLITLSAHKVGGPQGVGALWIKSGISIDPLIVGGSQESFFRAGTENISGIAGFAEAIKSISSFEFEKMLNHQKYIESELTKIAPVHIIGAEVDRLPNTICFCLNGLPSEVQLVALDLDGIGVSSGSACSSGKIGESHVLKAMGMTEEEYSSAIRISFGWATSDRDIKRFINSWSKLYSRTISKPT